MSDKHHVRQRGTLIAMLSVSMQRLVANSQSLQSELRLTAGSRGARLANMEAMLAM